MDAANRSSMRSREGSEEIVPTWVENFLPTTFGGPLKRGTSIALEQAWEDRKMEKSRKTNRSLKFSMKTSVDHPHEDVLTTIKAQHQVLRESIKVLKNEEAAVHLKQRHLARFLPYLKMHSEAEERTIYATLKEIDDAQVATIEAITEHALAKSLVSELEKKDFSSVWDSEIEAKAKVLAELVEHHADEEEEEFFEKARQNLAKIELVAIGQEFRSICKELQAREAEQVQPRRQRGHGERMTLKAH